jgi:hypothetical protein
MSSVQGGETAPYERLSYITPLLIASYLYSLDKNWRRYNDRAKKNYDLCATILAF